jgi:uncharacterized protein YjbI with pentapeptide repeats
MQLQSIVQKMWLLPLGLATMVSLPAPAQAFDPRDLQELQVLNRCNDGFCDLTDIVFIGYRFDFDQRFFPLDVTGADMRRANLTDSIASKGNFTRANLSNANLTRLNLFGATLNNANFTNANLSNAAMVRVTALRTNFTSANMSGVDLRDSNVTDANFTNANLSGANLVSMTGLPSNLAPQPLALTRTLSLESDQPTFTNFTGANLSNVSALNTQLPNAVFARARLFGSNFSGADLSGVDFIDADLSEATFLDVNLRGANITSEQLNSLGAFSGILPDGTVVGGATTTPEPSIVFALMGVGLLGSKLRSSKGKKEELN